MALFESKPAMATLSVFDKGPHTISSLNVKSSSNPSSPPKPLLVFTPVTEGSYPVILFFHGFYLRNHYYSDILQHVSSHGYIVVAPQLFELMPPSGPQEVSSAGEVVNWLPSGLQGLLPEHVEANIRKLALVGHSRGGKTAFSVALGYASTSLTFSALIGIDPVAGQNRNMQIEPIILTYEPESFDLNIPVTVIGTRLGGQRNWQIPPCAPDGVIPPCAPEGVNHEEFFNESKPPRAHFVTAQYGHMDMLDDNLGHNIVGTISACMCKKGNGPKEPMRKCVGGIVVAFLKFSLEGEERDFLSIVKDPSVAPVKLDPPPEFTPSQK